MFEIIEDTRLTTKIEKEWDIISYNSELFFYVPDELFQKVKISASSTDQNSTFTFIFENHIFGFRFDINYTIDNMIVYLDSYMLSILNWVDGDIIYINENGFLINFTKE